MVPLPSARPWIRVIQVSIVGSALAALAISTLPWLPEWLSWVYEPGWVAWRVAGKLGPSGNFPSDRSIVSFVLATWLSFVSATLFLWFIGRGVLRAIRGRSGGVR
jgi:hypothetical protein